MIQFQFNSKLDGNDENIAQSIKRLLGNKIPIIVCIGSDLVVGDSLGPLVGETLNKKLKGKAFVYGSLSYPITAKEAKTISLTIKKLHPYSQILVVDAAVGDDDDVGYIKITDKGIKPGLGVNKDLPLIGGVSVIGIVATKGSIISDLNGKTRLKTVAKMCEDISSGIIKAII